MTQTRAHITLFFWPRLLGEIQGRRKGAGSGARKGGLQKEPRQKNTKASTDFYQLTKRNADKHFLNHLSAPFAPRSCLFYFILFRNGTERNNPQKAALPVPHKT